MSDYETQEWHRLRARLTELCNKCPKSVWSASIQATIKWKQSLKRCKKILEKKSATNAEMVSAVNEMESYE